MKLFSIIFLALLLAACGDPHDANVPTDISKWSSAVKPSLQKLTPGEKILFSQYAIRHTIGAVPGHIGSASDPIPQDMTIGKAIQEQRDFIARLQSKELQGKTAGDKSSDAGR